MNYLDYSIQQSLQVYMRELIKKSRTILSEDFYYENILNDKFDIVNTYLIHKTINSSKNNLFMQNTYKGRTKNYYLPILIAVSTSLFFKNYCDDKTIYKIGDIVQDGTGKRYLINDFKEGRFELIGNVVDGIEKYYYYPKKLREFIITKAELSDRRSRIKFKDYKNYFGDLFGVDYFPSKFNYKAVVILEKQSCLNELNTVVDIKYDLKKSIPFMWVPRKGMDEDVSDYIPIEPMIYIAPDYETFQEHIVDKVENLDTLIIIGKNKYEPFLTKIKRDIRRETIKKVILVGSEDVGEINNIKKWMWTYPEICILNNEKPFGYKLIKAKSDDFLNIIQGFKKYINTIEEDYSINLIQILGLLKYIYSIIITENHTRLNTQVDYWKNIFAEKTKYSIEENLFSMNVNPDNIIKEALKMLDEMFDQLSYEKFNILLQQQQIDIIIVPSILRNAWNDIRYLYKRLSNTKIYSFNEFLKNEEDFDEVQNIFVLSIFGFSCKFHEIVRLLSQTTHKINYILYPEEINIFQNVMNNINNIYLNEYMSEDRKFLSGIDFVIEEEKKLIHEKIEDIYSEYSEEILSHGYLYSNQVNYVIVFDNLEIEEIEGNKTIILEKVQEEPRKEQVSNLMIGDRIRIYENTDRKKLFILAKEEDDEGRLDEILSYSKFWKESLLKFFNNVDDIFYHEESLLNELKSNGAKLKLPTLRNWLDLDNDNLFPNQISNLRAIQKTVNNSEFDSAFKDILKSRKLYRSIMISLGHNLSDELNEYILSKKNIKGEFLEKFSDNQIDSFLNHNAPLRTIKKIEILNVGLDE